MVIGFQDGRAAQVTELRWYDPEDSDEEERLSSVAVEVSVDGPLGPWQRLGEWDLSRAADGSVAPFELEAPVWARYVHLWAPLDEEARSWRRPDASRSSSGRPTTTTAPSWASGATPRDKVPSSG